MQRVFALHLPLGRVPAVHAASRVVACLLLAVAGLVAGVKLWREGGDVVAGFGGHALRAVLTVKLLFFLTVAAHQIVHGLALVHYRRRVREFGFTFLHGFVPTFYVDVTDIFMASRRARVVTAVSGALVHLVLGSPWFLLAAAGAARQLHPGLRGRLGDDPVAGLRGRALSVLLHRDGRLPRAGRRARHADAQAGGDELGGRPAHGGARRGGSAGRRRCGRPTSCCRRISVAAFIAFNVMLIVHASS